MGTKIELKFKCKSQDEMNKILEDLMDYFKIEYTPEKQEFEDIYYISDDGLDYRLRQNVTKSTYSVSQKEDKTLVNEEFGYKARYEKEVEIKPEDLPKTDENCIKVKKTRQAIKLEKGIVFGFEEVDDLGYFVEIEGKEKQDKQLLKMAKFFEKYDVIPERLSYKTQMIKRNMGEDKYYELHPDYAIQDGVQ